MANNIIGGRSNGMIAKTNTALSSIFDSANISQVTLLDGTPVTWRPDRQINFFTATVIGKSYIVKANQDLDRTANFYPPIDAGSGTTDQWAQKDW